MKTFPCYSLLATIAFLITAFVGAAEPAPIMKTSEFMSKHMNTDTLGYVFGVIDIEDGADDSYILNLAFDGTSMRVEVHTLISGVSKSFPGKKLLETARKAHAPFKGLDAGILSPLLVQLFPIKVGNETKLVPIFTLIDLALNEGFDGHIKTNDVPAWMNAGDRDSRTYLYLMSMIHMKTLGTVATNVGENVSLTLPITDFGGLGQASVYLAAAMK